MIIIIFIRLIILILPWKVLHCYPGVKIRLPACCGCYSTVTRTGVFFQHDISSTIQARGKYMTSKMALMMSLIMQLLIATFAVI